MTVHMCRTMYHF